MAGKGLHTYSVSEAQNAALGFGGSMYVDTAGSTILAPEGKVIIAIQSLDSAQIDILVAEDTNLTFSIAGGASFQPGHRGSVTTLADLFSSSEVLPSGITIYGRWTSFSLSAGKAIAYTGT